MRYLNKIAASLGLVLISSSAFPDFGSWTRNKSAAHQEVEGPEETITPDEVKKTATEIKQAINPPEQKPAFVSPESKPQTPTAIQKPTAVPPTYTPPTFSALQNQPQANSQLQKEEEMELSRFHASMSTMRSIQSQKGLAITPEQRIALSVLNATLMQAEFDSSAQTKAVYTQAVGCINSFSSASLNSAAQQLVNSKINGNASRIIYNSPGIGSSHSQKCAYQQ